MPSLASGLQERGLGMPCFLGLLLGTASLSLHPAMRECYPSEVCSRPPIKPQQVSAIQARSSPPPQTGPSHSQTGRLSQAQARIQPLSLVL